MNPIKPNTKIRILSPEHSEYVQKLAFEAGFKLADGRDYFPFSKDWPFISFDEDMKIWFIGINGLNSHHSKIYEEILIDLPQQPSDTNTKILAEKVGSKHGHYFKDVSDLDEIDVYRVCDLFEVNDASGAIQHALKKLLCSGQRGVKVYRKDLEEARDSIQRKLDVLSEDGE